MTKTVVLEAIKDLPEEFPLEDLVERLIMLKKTELGLWQAQEDKPAAREEARKYLGIVAHPMNIESLRTFCLSLPGVTEDIKWGYDLCFCIGEKMFCVTTADTAEGASFKVRDEEFDEMTGREGIIPAPYMARAKWVYVLDFLWLSNAEWQHFIRQSYELVKAKLPKKIQEALCRA